MTPPPAKKSAKPAGLRPDQLKVAPLVLISGGEDLLAERAVAAVLADARKQYPEVDVEVLDGSQYTSGQLDMATSPSLFGGFSVVIIESVESATDALILDTVAYAQAPEDEVCLVLRHGGGNRGKKILDTVRAAGAPEATCTAITRDDAKMEFVKGEFDRLKVKIAAPAVRLMVDALGSDLRELAAACAQLAADMQGKQISEEVVNTYFAGRMEVTGFKVADAAVEGRSAQALKLLRHALDTGVDPVPLVAAMAMKVRTLAKVQAAGSGRPAELAKELGLAPWQIEKAQRELRGWSSQRLALSVTALAQADHAIKGGSRAPLYAVEKAVLVVSGASVASA